MDALGIPSRTVDGVPEEAFYVWSRPGVDPSDQEILSWLKISHDRRPWCDNYGEVD